MIIRINKQEPRALVARALKAARSAQANKPALSSAELRAVRHSGETEMDCSSSPNYIDWMEVWTAFNAVMAAGLGKKTDPTAAARMKRARSKGKAIALTLTSQEAIDALEQLVARHGSQKSALEHALITAVAMRSDY